MLDGADGRVVIFDDFERALMAPAAILGYINPMVEHEDCKTIIIADESQIDGQKKADYDKRKEKTVGQTFQFEPDTQRVYDSFLKEIDDEEARTFLERSKSVILQVFADFCLANLRLLKQLLWDFERIWEVLTPEQQAKSVAMQELLTLVCAAALELRSGRLAESDFQFVRPASSMDETKKRYPTVRFDSALLDADTIRDCVLRSRVSKVRVQKQLASHPYFANDGQVIPSWRALWLSFQVSPDKQDELVEKFEDDFDARSFEDQGVIYHVIGLGLWLARLGYPNWLDAEIESKVQRYVVDLYSRRSPSLEEASEREMSDESMGTDGLGYRESENPRFRALVKYEREQRTAWRKQGYPAIAAYLLQLANADGQAFCERCASPMRDRRSLPALASCI